MNAKIQIKSLNKLGVNISESMNINPDIAVNALADNSDTAIQAATLIDTFARLITSLTTNTYNDTNITLIKKTEDHINNN